MSGGGHSIRPGLEESWRISSLFESSDEVEVEKEIWQNMGSGGRAWHADLSVIRSVNLTNTVTMCLQYNFALRSILDIELHERQLQNRL